jgi:polyisoprenyl-teichoic acid--peptidoglycan teichoic acid transferase
MTEQNPNLLRLEEKPKTEDSKAFSSLLDRPDGLLQQKKSIIGRLFKMAAVFFIFCLVTLLIFTTQALYSGYSGGLSNAWYKNISFIAPIQQLVESADRKLKGEENDRINILLLGMGGEKHSGGYLTDTIMLVSIQPSTKKVSMLSIPRDLVVPIEGMGWKKINSINSYAELKNPGDGGQAVSQAIGDILDIPINYFIRVDFQGFIKIVDELGGVKVTVDNQLDDYRYPIMGRENSYPLSSRYEHLSVKPGETEMDGELALKFARSRHGLGAEGSDFARARRQQKIIEAVKDKALSLETLFKPLAIKNIITVLDNHVSMNVEIPEMIKFWQLSKGIKRENIINKVLDTSAGGLLVNGRGDEGAYILEPRSGDFTEIQYLVKNIFSDAPQKEKNEIAEESARVEIRNGTWVNGLASHESLDLEKYGFKVVRVSNAGERNLATSTIYDITYGAKLKSLKILKEKTGASVGFGLPEWLDKEMKEEASTRTMDEKPDFILVLGQDTQEK